MSSSNIDKLIKISLIGQPAVGKTTMLKLLSQNPIDKLYLPTQGLDLKTVKFGNFNLKVWDFGGQKAYLKTCLKENLMGSDLIFVVTDSTPRNVLTSRELIDHSKNIVNNDCKIIAIANKQDLCKVDGRMAYKRVEDVLHIKTFGLTAINPANRIILMDIITKELNQVLIRRRLRRLSEIEF